MAEHIVPKLITLTPSKVKPAAYVGQTIIFPVIGEATFTEAGTLQVDEGKLDSFLLATQDSFGFYEKVDSDSNKKSKIQEMSEEEEKIVAELNLLDSKALIELAKESGMKPEDLVKMTNGKIKKELTKIMLSDK